MNPIAKCLSLLSHSRGESQEYYETLVPKLPMGEGIPKQIHQIYITPDDDSSSPLPAEVCKHINYTLGLNPDYSHHVYRNAEIADFIIANYGESMLAYYNRIDAQYGAAKADLFRYLLLYKCGGVYLDLRVLFHKPLNEIVNGDDRYILSYWDNQPGQSHEGWGLLFRQLAHIDRGELIMGFIIAASGHPFLREVIIAVLKNIDSYNPHVHDVGYGGTISTTGPIPYTISIYDFIQRYPDVPYRIVDAVNECNFEYFVQKRSLVKTDYRKAYNPLVRNKKLFVQKMNEYYFYLLSQYRQHIVTRRAAAQ